MPLIVQLQDFGPQQTSQHWVKIGFSCKTSSLQVIVIPNRNRGLGLTVDSGVAHIQLFAGWVI
jgi:hypothetical protein